MSDIKRYMPLLYDYGMEDQNDGEYVKYADYEAAIEQLQARIAELENRSTKEMLDEMGSDDRAELFTQYCTHCGSRDPRCQCWNDE